MESKMVQNSGNKIGLTIKVKRDFNQAQQNHFTFKRFSLKVKTFRFKVNKITSSLSTNFLSRARHIWVKLKRLLELLSKKNFSQFQASFHINPKFPVTFQQLDLSRSSRQWRDAQRSQISASTTTLTTVNKVVNPQCNIHCKKRRSYGFTWKQIADMLLVSRWTIMRRVVEIWIKLTWAWGKGGKCLLIVWIEWVPSIP